MTKLFLTLILLLSTVVASASDFENSYALVIGINDYSDLQLKKLTNAEADAISISKYLQTQGYAVASLIGPQEATKKNVEQAIDTFARTMKPRSRFLFFFAGHGRNETVEGLDIAYLVLPRSDVSEEPNNLLSSGDIHRYSRKLDSALHQLFIFDSCYSGLMGSLDVRSQRTAPKYQSEKYLLESLQARKVRQFLAAGGSYQEVLDGGPYGLSWFTYFLLKGLEPNQASFRPSGLITFSEFASFVQTRSANPRHTPAFGSLFGHGGGEYLFRDSSKSKPSLPHLPNISENVLYNLGFLTRASDQGQVTKLLPEMKSPIENLFEAWRTLDVELYLEQFDPQIIQTGIYKSGKPYTRGFNEIEENRRKIFPKLDSVDVSKFELMYQGFSGRVATFGVRYSMIFKWKSGKVTKDTNVNECYQVANTSVDPRWRIIRNDDYQKELCSSEIR